jgi:NADP-dependent 3-hydroxy acid dehydrogenase YdfG
MSKTIFITGASKGFGKIWVESFLQRGHKVAATSRNISALDDLTKNYSENFLPLQLDITNRSEVIEAVNRAISHFGSLDVIINNAGYGLFGAIEEISEQDAKDVINTNILGTLWVTQAALPILREQRSGHIIQLSSVLGLWTLPTLGIYSATKFAVEGLSDALSQEVAGFGINVTLIEPNGYHTEFGGSSAVSSKAIAAYDQVKAKLASSEGMQPEDYGNPEATVDAINLLINSENPPLRFFLGKLGLPKTTRIYAEHLAEWNSWSEVAEAAHGKSTPAINI